jgi:hypothetical protein
MEVSGPMFTTNSILERFNFIIVFPLNQKKMPNAKTGYLEMYVS